MRLNTTILAVIASGLSLAAVGQIQAAVITSTDFSFGYGANLNSATNTWQLQSPSTSTTSGDFLFSPAISGGFYSSAGPTFGSRVLTTAASGATYTGRANSFALTIEADWAGTVPIDATNVQITLEITEISIYGLRYVASGDTGSQSVSLTFNETTAGHLSSSSAQLLQTRLASQTSSSSGTGVNNLRPADYYNQLVWNPGDFAEDGTSTSRGFSLSTTDGIDVAIDGFQVYGRVIVSYDVVPEPGTVGLAVAGGLLVLGMRLRRR